MADLKLSFLNNKLDKEQIQNAEKVAKAAIAAGVDPALAVSIAFKESSLRTDVKDSDKGAIGMMQVIIPTGKGLGFSEADLRNPEKNLEAGIKGIKEALGYAENNPKLAALYYHSGPDAIADIAANKPLGPNAKEYLQKLKEFGTFEAFKPNAEAPVEAQPVEPAEPVEPPAASLADAKQITTEQDFIRPNSAADLKRQEYGALGGAAGVGVGLAPYAGRTAAGTAGKLARAFNEAKQAVPTPPTAPMGGLPTGGAPTPPPAPPSAPTGAPAGGLPNTQGQPPSVVRQAPATGYGTYNYGISQGLPDIEAGLAKDMTKEAGGVHDLLTQRREGLNRLQGMGANNFVENPRFGGIMTQAPSVGGGPRESFVMRPEVPASPDVPRGQPSQLAPLPRAPIVSSVPPPPPPPSGLDQVKNIFTSMMKYGAKAMPYVAPPLAMYSMGRDVADIESQYGRAPNERDYTDMGLSAASALATGASLTPAFPVAAPLSVAIPTYRNIRRNVLAQESDPELQARNRMPPTAEEIEMASQPAFRYPNPVGRPPFRPRVPELGSNLPPAEFIR
jgi:hypothetical protein